MRGTLALLLSSLTSVALTGDAFAFQIETPITYGCHEKVTVEARRAAGFPDPAQAPEPTEDQRRVAQDLTFTLPADDGDLWTMTLLIGLRSNDIKDHQIIDPSALVEIHDDPRDQQAHCLRRIEDNGPEGDASAIAACRGFIMDELFIGRFFNDSLDLTTTEPVPLYLAFRHKVTVDLPRFAYRLGRAVHALEDGFAHTLRNPETGAVRHVTNWIDFSSDDDYDIARDGHQHLSTIDDCLRNTTVERYHLNQAEAAVTDLLDALRDPSGDGDARRARVEAALDRAFVIEPGCTHENRYCSAPELDELSPGCSAAGSGDGAGVGALWVLGALLVGARRRRLLVVRGPAVVVMCAVVLGGATRLWAQPVAQQPQEQQQQQTASPDNANDGERARRERRHVWHADFRFGAALDHAALAFTGGVGVDVRLWTYGLAVEWNPWFSLDTGRARQGALNVYATLARRWYDDDRFTLYSRAELGTSTVLFDLVGVDQYRTGVYLGGALLGVAIKKRHGLRLTLDPSHFAMPIPRPTGLPFYWRQYRVAIGLELHFE